MSINKTRENKAYMIKHFNDKNYWKYIGNNENIVKILYGNN